jgi:hypothetical protein
MLENQSITKRFNAFQTHLHHQKDLKWRFLGPKNTHFYTKKRAKTGGFLRFQLQNAPMVVQYGPTG